MSNEVQPDISNVVVALLEELDNDFLADVLRLWDCETQDWYGRYPMVLRFESNDVLLWQDRAEINARTGAVDTSALDVLLPNALDPALTRNRCLSWRFASDYANLIGEKGLSTKLLARIRSA